MCRDCVAPRTGTNAQRPVGRVGVNAIIPPEAEYNEEEQNNLEGTLTLHNTRVRVLFDTGAMNSFIAIRTMQLLGLPSQNLDVPLDVVSPLGPLSNYVRYIRIAY